MAYILKIFDTDLVRFEMFRDGLSGLNIKITDVNHDFMHLMPFDLEFTGEGMFKWLKRRVIPKNRAFVDEILRSLRLTLNDTKGIIDVCKGLSLNDSYWVVPDDFSGKFSDLNLYQNRFSEALSLIAYTGVGYGNTVFTTSPELTTNGTLPKAWRNKEGKLYLYKGGSSGGVNTGREPYVEFYAYQIAEQMGLNAVPYTLERWKGITASVCPLFCDIDTAYVPVYQVVRSGGLPAVLEYYSARGSAFKEHIHSMLVFDALIYNTDRHYGNFGFLRDNKSGEIIAPAPIFDNGYGLLKNAYGDDFKDLLEYAKVYTPPYDGVTFEEICSFVMGKQQKAELRKLIGFKFKRHPSLNLPEFHLKALEQFLQSRVRELLSIPADERSATDSNQHVNPEMVKIQYDTYRIEDENA